MVPRLLYSDIITLIEGERERARERGREGGREGERWGMTKTL